MKIEHNKGKGQLPFSFSRDRLYAFSKKLALMSAFTKIPKDFSFFFSRQGDL